MATWQDKPVGRARRLRRDMTEAERRLWAKLRDRTLAGRKFRRQYPVQGYVVDFVCLEEKLIIELDGGQHATRTDADARRTTRLETQGFRVLRFWNNEVMENLDGVLATIVAALHADAGGPQ